MTDGRLAFSVMSLISLMIWALVGKRRTLLVPRSRMRNSCLWRVSVAMVAFAGLRRVIWAGLVG